VLWRVRAGRKGAACEALQAKLDLSLERPAAGGRFARRDGSRRGERDDCNQDCNTPSHDSCIDRRPPIDVPQKGDFRAWLRPCASLCGRLDGASLGEPGEQEHLDRARDGNGGERAENPGELRADEHGDEDREG
jgi:hypothetical protein